LWHQVRCMATALLHVSQGEADETCITSLLEGVVTRSPQPAPAEGLVLHDTDCGIAWTPIPVDKRSSMHMDHIERHHALMAQVCRVLTSSDLQ
jgi:tRNA pseudouridine38-40 synthase